MPPNCTWQTLRDEFRSCGEVKFAEIRGQDCGVVRFAKERDAELAISKCLSVQIRQCVISNSSIYNHSFVFCSIYLQNLKTDHVSMVARSKFHSFKWTLKKNTQNLHLNCRRMKEEEKNANRITNTKTHTNFRKIVCF